MKKHSRKWEKAKKKQIKEDDEIDLDEPPFEEDAQSVKSSDEPECCENNAMSVTTNWILWKLTLIQNAVCQTAKEQNAKKLSAYKEVVLAKKRC